MALQTTSQTRLAVSTGRLRLALARLCLLTLPLAACAQVPPAAEQPVQAAPVSKPLPVPRSLTLNAMANLLDWNRTPPGVNPSQCTPAPGQNPVLLVHGTFANMMLAFSALGPTLHNAGLCAYAYNYGAWQPNDWVHGLAPMEESARLLAQEVDKVRQRTGAQKVDLIGHSQGGTLIHYYAKVLNGAPHIGTLIAVAPSLRGSPWVKSEAKETAQATNGTPRYCMACKDQHPESAVLRKLNDGPIAQPGNRNFVLATANDWVVYPVERQFIREPGVHNVLLQDLHPGRWATHSGLLYDPDALRLMVNWLQGGNSARVSTPETEPQRPAL